MEKEKFSEIMKSHIKKMGITQRELAEQLNMAKSQLSNIFVGRERAGAKNAPRIAQALDIDPLWLMTQGEQGTPPTAKAVTPAITGERIIDRLDQFMDVRGLTDSEVTKECGLSIGLINQARGGKCDIGKKAVEKILARYTDINRVWFITGEGDMLNTSDVVTLQPSGCTAVYNIDATCGEASRPIDFTSERIIGYVNLPNVSKDAYIIRANGDSMQQVIKDGDWIAVREVKNYDDIYWGQIYLVITPEYRLLKYVRRNKEDDTAILLRSENPNFDDMVLAKAKIVHLYVVENILSLKIQF